MKKMGSQGFISVTLILEPALMNKASHYTIILDYTEVQKNGYGIGIYNTVMRLRLMFGDMASIFFSNEPGLGARIDIDIPFISDLKTDAEQTNHLHTTR